MRLSWREVHTHSQRGDLTALREQEEQRWISSETLLQLRSAVVKVELIDGPGCLRARFLHLVGDTCWLPGVCPYHHR